MMSQLKSLLTRGSSIALAVVAVFWATIGHLAHAGTQSSLCNITLLPGLCRQGTNTDSTGLSGSWSSGSGSVSVSNVNLQPAVQNSGVGGVNIVRITTPGSGIYYKPAGVKKLLIRAVGGGGSGSLSEEADSDVFGGAGGGAGGYAEKFISSPSSSYAYTVGSGGVSGRARPGKGGTTTIAGMRAEGGGPGYTGGNASGGDINVRGGDGGRGCYRSCESTDGGNSALATGGKGGDLIGLIVCGGNGVLGSGGGGGRCPGKGGDGYIEIWEFY